MNPTCEIVIRAMQRQMRGMARDRRRQRDLIGYVRNRAPGRAPDRPAQTGRAAALRGRGRDDYSREQTAAMIRGALARGDGRPFDEEE